MARRTKPSRKRFILPGLLVLAVAASIVLYFINRSSGVPTGNIPVSYRVMLIAQERVKGSKPPPTTGALQYAYVASVYSDSLEKGSQAEALVAAVKMIGILYPTDNAATITSMLSIAKDAKLKLPKNNELSEPVQAVLAKYQNRYKKDGHDLVWDKVVPTGPGKWIKKLPVDPFTPRAGEWERWFVTASIDPPKPPVYGGNEDMRQLAIVRHAAANRTGQDVNIINFWGGVPGTEGPSGIWQNQLYRTVKDELPNDRKTADKQYALVQKYLAQAMSDAFMECWETKYDYWTARPDMRDASIKTAMPNPNFPSYISGHSTISKAAADVLSKMVPKHKSQWQSWAIEARDSRLKAGIHFEVDNLQGFAVGAAVAKQAINRLNLKPIL